MSDEDIRTIKAQFFGLSEWEEGPNASNARLGTVLRRVAEWLEQQADHRVRVWDICTNKDHEDEWQVTVYYYE